MAVYLFSTIEARKLSKFKFTNALREVMFTQTREAKRLLEKTVESWTGPRPEFKQFIGLVGGSLEGSIQLRGSEFGIDKWNWLNEGTEVRYRHFAPGFVAKTTPNVLASFPGQDSHSWLRRMPAPGIEARNWTLLVEDTLQGSFEKEIRRFEAGYATNPYV